MHAHDRPEQRYTDWIVGICNNKVLINALVTSAIVGEEEKDDGTRTTRAALRLFTSYFDSVPYAAANGQGKILAVSSSTSGRQDECSAGYGTQPWE